jgi:hypothetical protein
MRKNRIYSLLIVLTLCLSCDYALENIKDKAIKVIDEQKVAIDSTLNNEINNKINKVDTLLNHQKK